MRFVIFRQPTILGSVESLTKLMESNESQIIREIIAKLQVHPDPTAQVVIRKIAEMESLPTDIHLLAVAALQPNSKENIATLLQLLESEKVAVNEEALRSLNGFTPKPGELTQLKDNA